MHNNKYTVEVKRPFKYNGQTYEIGRLIIGYEKVHAIVTEFKRQNMPYRLYMEKVEHE